MNDRSDATALSGSGELPLITLLNILLRHKRGLLIALVACTALATAWAVSSRHYVAVSQFAPETREVGGLSRLAGLATQFGIDIAGSGGLGSLDFYATLLRSRAILETVLSLEHPAVSGATASNTLLDLYGGNEETVEARTRRAIRRLRDDVHVTVNAAAGLVRLEVSAASPDLARALNARLLEVVNRFDVQTRRSRARAERQFVEQRLEAAQRDLQEAEQELRDFMQRNRAYEQSSPQQFEAAQLQRRVDLRQQVFVSLSQAYEEARILEVRDTPVLTIVDKPEVLADVRPGVSRGVILGILAGMLFGSLWAFAAEFNARQRSLAPEAYAEFKQHVKLQRR